jgi:hypothetical protein
VVRKRGREHLAFSGESVEHRGPAVPAFPDPVKQHERRTTPGTVAVECHECPHLTTALGSRSTLRLELDVSADRSRTQGVRKPCSAGCRRW